MRTFLLGLAACLVVAVGCARPHDPAHWGPASLAAVVRVRGPDNIAVPVAVVNATDGPFRVAARNGRDLMFADATLYRDGREVLDGAPPKVDEDTIRANDVLVAPPGGVGRLTYKLRYSRVRPGLYELRITYRSGGAVPPGGPDLTAATFEQRTVLDVYHE